MEEEDPQGLSGLETVQQRCEDGTACPVEAVGETEQEALLWSTASCYSSYLTATAQGEIQQLEQSLEEMLTRVDEFCGMLDMIRNDSSQIMNENIPEIHAKADEMKQLYKKIDKLEKSPLPKRQQQRFEHPTLFRTEDYFPVQNS
ncbi:biogenesis of lysosome-related organelles complex 1 subunit 4-like isoform X2 [Stegostoma tigrinum]|uniref:biogenesis of lysosome-related organelles complex 1 subunit 4-like isoform X2 n=1 Tax=Stegostoma tigrinum TaxID=3053191 RepID=UPI00202B8DB1|nr:biogenesis of lysosome-related organelles complex 1 subunit 4-like isoform X2 [Stegostoma tigrinum]